MIKKQKYIDPLGVYIILYYQFYYIYILYIYYDIYIYTLYFRYSLSNPVMKVKDYERPMIIPQSPLETPGPAWKWNASMLERNCVS